MDAVNAVVDEKLDKGETQGMVVADDLTPLAEANSLLQKCVANVLAARASDGANWYAVRQRVHKTLPRHVSRQPSAFKIPYVT